MTRGIPRPGSVARAEDLLTACVRECAGWLAGRAGEPPGPERTRLVAAIGVLIVEHTAPEPSGDRRFEALLTAGGLALRAREFRLARRLAGTAVGLRDRSREAWRLRGEVLDAHGRDKDAIDAYERCQARGGDDEALARRLALLRERWGAVLAASRIVPEARLLESSPAELPEAFAEAVRRRGAETGPGDPDTRRLAEAHATFTRLTEKLDAAEPS